MKCVLIQANGNNVRLGKFFKQPKYELFYKGKRIIEHIISNAIKTKFDVFLSIRDDITPKFDTKNVKLIRCSKTESRGQTLVQCFEHLKNYETTIIHDCDVIIDCEILKELNNNSIAITNYRLDGMKYGFINLDKNFKYISGNEKLKEESHITIGAYSVKNSEFNKFLKTNDFESLLDYYNTSVDKTVVFSKNHINLGDIDSYFQNI